MSKYEVLNRGHRVEDNNGEWRQAEVGEIIDLPERAAAPLVPWRLKPRPDLDTPAPAGEKKAKKPEKKDGDA